MAPSTELHTVAKTHKGHSVVGKGLLRYFPGNIAAQSHLSLQSERVVNIVVGAVGTDQH